jgi:hypothetical protein
MTSRTKIVLKRLIFWVILLAAPITFLSLAFIYTNAYMTSDRVSFVFTPFIEVLSDRTVIIERSEIHIGYNTKLEFNDLFFYDTDGAEESAMTIADAHIRRIYLQVGTFSLFTNAIAIDSLVIEDLTGTVRSGWQGWQKTLQWKTGRDTETDKGNTVSIEIEKNDVRVKHFIVRDAHFSYENDTLGWSINIQDYDQDISIDLITLVNMLLINGTIRGTILDPQTGNACTISLTGSLQVNFDDGTILLRNGYLGINENIHPFTAIVQKDNNLHRLRVLFEQEEEYASGSLQDLPHPLREWVYGRNDRSSIRTELIYDGSD